MRKHLTIKQEGSIGSCKEVTMNTSDFVDQLNDFPTLENFNASSTSKALKWTDLIQRTRCQRVLLIRNMDNRLFCLSRKLMDSAVVLGYVAC